MSDTFDNTVSLKDMKIVKGARHCRIVDNDGEILFRTTNLRDAEAYLALVEENRRLQHLLETRGVAPHRIYILEGGDPDDEIVIVAKAGSEAVVVRHLADGREEVVELDEVKAIPEANYFIGASKPVEEINISVRYDQDAEVALIRAHRSTDSARSLREAWRRASFESDKSVETSPSWSENGCTIFSDMVVIED